MPWDEVMHKWKGGKLHSTSKSGPVVKNRKQAIAIMLSEKKQAAEGKEEYQPSGSTDTTITARGSARRGSSVNVSAGTGTGFERLRD